LSKCVWVVACATALTGCELWLNVDALQCKTDQNCRELVGIGFTCGAAGVCVAPVVKPDAGDGKPALPERWACAEKDPDIFVPDDRELHIHMDAVEFNTLKVPPGLTATTCRPADVACSDPIASEQQPGSDGYFDFVLPYGFGGFVMFTAPNIVPSLLYRNRPYFENVTTSGPALATVATLDDISKSAGRPHDPATGVAILDSRDCADNPGEGIAFDNIGDEGPFYFDGTLPARGLTSTVISSRLSATNERRAVGGFSNLAPGLVTFESRLEKTGDAIGKTTVPIRAGYITYVRMYPGNQPR
jgi:hypothetical protein